MLIIGLTGTMGSGKSTASEYFTRLGAAVISADEITRQLTSPGTPIFQTIVERFGKDILLPTGTLNRKKLREIILKDVNDKLWLENILHPEIRSEIKQEISKIKSPYCIIEIPLLKDKSHYPYLDRVLLITANPKDQIKRLMLRDQCTEKQAQDFLDIQAINNQRQILADDIIENTGSLENFLQKIKIYHQLYLKG